MPIQRIPLTQPIETRDGYLLKDSRSVNCYFETRDQKREFVKRPGLVKAVDVVNVTPPTVAQSQGLAEFNNQIIAVIDNTVYRIDPLSYSVNIVGNISGATDQCSFVKDFLNQHLVIQNRTNAYYMTNSNSFAQITLPENYTIVPGLVFLDQYIFMADSNNRIYNSNLGDPTTWGALNYIAFEQSTDNIVGIAKHFNYLVAFGQWSMQFYYDAGYTNGSPLDVIPSYMSEIGCANGDSIVSTEQTVLWVGTSKVQGKSVYALDGTTPVRVSTAYIDRIIENSNLLEMNAYVYKVNGHSLYILTLHDINVTLVYDLTEKMWYQWTQWALGSGDQAEAGTYHESYFRPTFYADVLNKAYCLDDDRGILYSFSDNAYTDDGAPIYCRSVTDIVDNGTTKRKFYQRVEIIGDKVSANMRIRHSGNDYRTWSSYRTVDLNKERPQIYQTGQDRRRSWEFLCTDAVPLRLDAAEIDFEIGELDQSQGVGATQYRR